MSPAVLFLLFGVIVVVQRACLNSYNPSSNPAEADRVLVSDASWIAIQKYDGHHWKLFCMYKIYRV